MYPPLRELCQVSGEEFAEADRLQRDLGGDISQLLVQTGAISETRRQELLSEYLHIPLFTGNWKADEELVAFLQEALNYEFLLKNLLLPFSADHDRKILQAVTGDPFRYGLFNYVSQTLGYQLELFLAPEKQVADLAHDHLAAQQQEDIVSLAVPSDAEKLKEMAFEAPVIKYLNTLLSKAVEMRASDVHIESSEKSFRVRLRIDGILHDHDTLDEAFYLAIVSRIKLLSELDIAEKRLPQDGKFATRIASLFLDIRVSTLPTASGEGVVLRLLYRENISLDLDALGLAPDHREMVLQLISHAYGMLLVTGPTGSGKTTSLYTMLTRLNRPECKIITIEDPVEYRLPGINQIQVRSDIGMTFAAALRSILRHDPDIVMVGEIRDRETAEISIQAALTGHLVLSTLHTNDAPSSLFRLIEMGNEDYLLNAAVIGVIAQRIVRRNCPACSKPDPQALPLLHDYGVADIAQRFPELLAGEIRPQRGTGCPACNGTGYRGRVAVYEVFTYTDRLKEVFLKERSLEAVHAELRAQPDFRYLREDGILKVARGETTLDEVLRVC